MESKSSILVARDIGLSGPGTKLVILSLVCPFVAGLLVFNRIYWRLRIENNFGLDDMTILCSLCFLIGLCATNIAAVDFGYGIEFYRLSYEDAAQALMLVYVGQTFYIITLNLTKVAIAFLYLRIFERLWFRAFCRAMVEMAVLGGTAFSLVTIFQCNPISVAWQGSTHFGVCILEKEFWNMQSGFNIATDVMLAIMPSIALIPLKISRSMKLFLSLAFGLGLLVSIVSIFRAKDLFNSFEAYDSTADGIVVTMWSTTEASMGIICACLPMLRQFIEVWFPNLFPSPELRNDEETAHLHPKPSSSTTAISTTRNNAQPYHRRFIPGHRSASFDAQANHLLGPKRRTSIVSFPPLSPPLPHLSTPSSTPQRSLRHDRRSNIWRDVQQLYHQEGWTHPSANYVQRMALREDTKIAIEEAAETEMIANRLAKLAYDITDDERIIADEVRGATMSGRSLHPSRIPATAFATDRNSILSTTSSASIEDTNLPVIFQHEFSYRVFRDESILFLPTAVNAVFIPLREMDFGLTPAAGLAGVGKEIGLGGVENRFNHSRFLGV